MSRRYKNPYKIYWIVIAVLFGTIGGFLMWFCRECNLVIVYFLTVNILTGVLYLWDKMIAGTKIVRIPEVVLHSLALLGGSPVALLSQKIFRHKTSKKNFIIIYWLIVLVQASVWIYFLIRPLQ